MTSISQQRKGDGTGSFHSTFSVIPTAVKSVTDKSEGVGLGPFPALAHTEI